MNDFERRKDDEYLKRVQGWRGFLVSKPGYLTVYEYQELVVEKGFWRSLLAGNGESSLSVAKELLRISRLQEWKRSVK